MDGPPQRLFLSGEFTAVRIHSDWRDAALPRTRAPTVPAVFYALFVHNLCKWMRVYDCRDALEHAEMAMIDMDEEQLQDSCYPQSRRTSPCASASA